MPEGKAGRGGGRAGGGGQKPYGLLEHTADIGMWVWGQDPAALFAHAALGLREILAPPPPAPGWRPLEEQRLVELRAPDWEALLVDWLNELLYLLDTERLVPAAAAVELEGTALRARVRMEALPPGQAPRREPKAATFHGLTITPESGGLCARVIFDV
ncbi:MAG: archease [Acetobacteraceae bacterium]|nr:archease [Acetobacteraceae bacterium]